MTPTQSRSVASITRRIMRLQLAVTLASFAMAIPVNEAWADLVYGWGSNGGGELGDGSTANSAVPVAVSALPSGAVAVAAGADHSLAVENGTAYTWGWNLYG